MTVAVRPTNGTRRPVVIEVERHELVGRLMDEQALAVEAIEANGAALQLVLRLPPGPWRDELQRCHHDAHERLVALLASVRLATGVYEATRIDGGHSA